MTDHKKPKKPLEGREKRDTREARLSSSLRENLLKRKAQARARVASAMEKTGAE